MKINPKGYWENSTDEGHGVDEKLANGILNFLYEDGVKSVIDLGCGNGYYVKRLNDAHVYCRGYDGNPYTREFALDGNCFVYDLTTKLPLGVRLHPFGWALSLEVGEHIPREYEQIFINNIAMSCTEGAIISWAIPDQGGDGHVNCRTNEYIINEFQKVHLVFDLLITARLRSCASPYPQTGYWFKNTLMVFRKRDYE